MSAPDAIKNSGRRTTRAFAGALVRTARPGQWVKNMLVFAAPAAAREIDRPSVALQALLACVCFTLASAGAYFLNDARDAEADRGHPDKRTRPVAAGLVGRTTAQGIGLALFTVAAGAATMIGLAFLAVLVAYIAVTIAYSAWLKRIALLEAVVVAGGFVLRAVAGGAATGVPLTNWFLLVALFGALFLVLGKRRAEQTQLREHAAAHRVVLTGYPADWLQQVLTMSLTATVISYCMWAFQYLGGDVFIPVLAASALPFIITLMRYGLLVSQGAGQSPEHVIASDRFIQVAATTWAILVFTGLYLA